MRKTLSRSDRTSSERSCVCENLTRTLPNAVGEGSVSTTSMLSAQYTLSNLAFSNLSPADAGKLTLSPEGGSMTTLSATVTAAYTASCVHRISIVRGVDTVIRSVIIPGMVSPQGNSVQYAWDGLADDGSPAEPGVYYFDIVTDADPETALDTCQVRNFIRGTGYAGFIRPTSGGVPVVGTDDTILTQGLPAAIEIETTIEVNESIASNGVYKTVGKITIRRERGAKPLKADVTLSSATLMGGIAYDVVFLAKVLSPPCQRTQTEPTVASRRQVYAVPAAFFYDNADLFGTADLVAENLAFSYSKRGRALRLLPLPEIWSHWGTSLHLPQSASPVLTRPDHFSTEKRPASHGAMEALWTFEHSKRYQGAKLWFYFVGHGWAGSRSGRVLKMAGRTALLSDSSTDLIQYVESQGLTVPRNAAGNSLTLASVSAASWQKVEVVMMLACNTAVWDQFGFARTIKTANPGALFVGATRVIKIGEASDFSERFWRKATGLAAKHPFTSAQEAMDDHKREYLDRMGRILTSQWVSIF